MKRGAPESAGIRSGQLHAQCGIHHPMARTFILGSTARPTSSSRHQFHPACAMQPHDDLMIEIGYVGNLGRLR